MRAVALLSGGLDSGVAAATFARAPGQQLLGCLFVDYGQRAARREADAAARLAARLGAPLLTLALPWLGALAQRSGSRLVGAADLPHGTPRTPGDAASARAVWVPARNVVFVAAAAAHAEALGADAVVAGFNREEAATFPDNSVAFVQACDEVLRHGTRNGVRVVSPTLPLDKPAIVAAARELGFVAGDFWSCYDGGEEPCGRCESCLRSRWVR
ncbi:MAG: 7-cyano-7-deazaguanine synthase QueC [Planctomycetes bacterium]|nr:7-cyano-7-deazaguanine synthase QueC [Planctomycetota bacterium]